MSWLSGLFSNTSFRLDYEIISNVILLILALALISFFIWEFYRSISKRNLISLNLKKYNSSNQPVFRKLVAIIFYLVEYAVVMPILILLWFVALAFVLLIISEDGTAVQQVLLISAVVVGASRILAYFKNEIAEDLAKLFPLIALSVYVFKWGNLFAFSSFSEKIKEFALLSNHIFLFMVAIFIVEFFLRVSFTLVELWRSEENALDG